MIMLMVNSNGTDAVTDNIRHINNDCVANVIA